MLGIWTLYEQRRFESVAGDTRKMWKLFKRVHFKQRQYKKDSVITNHGVPVDDTPSSSYNVNEHVCASEDINSPYQLYLYMDNTPMILLLYTLNWQTTADLLRL